MDNEQPGNKENKNSLKDYFSLGEVFTYWFRKKDPSRPHNINLKMMHGINKISMLMFLICLIVIIVRAIIR